MLSCGSVPVEGVGRIQMGEGEWLVWLVACWVL